MKKSVLLYFLRVVRGGKMITKEQIIESLELRYDYSSARTIFAEALQKAQIPAGKASFSIAEVEALGNALSRLGDRLDRVLVAIKGLIEQAKAREEAAKVEVAQEPQEDALKTESAPFGEELQVEPQPKKKKR
jgi:hypothetical protein